MNRRDLFKFLAGIGLGAVTIETYERLHHIPMLETMFRKELEYWINQYNIAREEVERLTGKLRKREDEISSLRSDLTKSKEELEYLMQRYSSAREEVSRLSEMLKQSVEEINSLKEKTNYWETQYNITREEVGRLNSIINKIDELERESTSAIEYYRGRMDEAIRKLRETIERYRVLLGDERVSFEYSTLKILEDLRLAEERLQRVLPYFPLILNLYWRPMRVVNDKIYDVNVVFEVISPLSSLEVVEVTLRPIEYKYFISMYGMREEDYSKVFPEEDVRIVRIKPLQIERMVFSVDFKDLKGGREYAIEVRVRDVAGNEGRAKIKTPYIRQFENIANRVNIRLQASYMPWNFKNTPMKDETPLLGRYDVDDEIVQWKHKDWADGYGIYEYVIDMDGLGGRYSIPTNLMEKGMRVSVFFGPADFLRGTNSAFPDWVVDLEHPYNYNLFLKKIKIVASWAKHTNYSRIGIKPLVMIYDSIAFLNNSRAYKDAKEVFKEITGTYPYLIADEIPKIPYTLTDIQYYMKYKDLSQIDALTGWAGYHNRAKEEYVKNYEKLYENHILYWSKFAKDNKFGFIPTVIPGFDNSYSWGPPNLPPIERSPYKFKERLDISKEFIDSNIGAIRIDTFNDFGEWSYIEPSTKSGFEYLETLREWLKEKTLN